MRPGEERRREGQREARIAVAELRDEQIVADQQGRDHRAGRDVERLESEGPDAHGDQDRIDDRLDVLEQAARFALRHVLRHGGRSSGPGESGRMKPTCLPPVKQGAGARRDLAEPSEMRHGASASRSGQAQSASGNRARASHRAGSRKAARLPCPVCMSSTNSRPPGSQPVMQPRAHSPAGSRAAGRRGRSGRRSRRTASAAPIPADRPRTARPRTSARAGTRPRSAPHPPPSPSNPASASAAGSGLRPAPGTRMRQGASAPLSRQARKAGCSPPRSQRVVPGAEPRLPVGRLGRRSLMARAPRK